MKKTLSIILAILMLVTTIPMAFAADETPDFSDAKVLTSVDGVLYIDGVEAKTNSDETDFYIYEGKYILGGDIETSRYIWILGATTLDLNGYTWNLTDVYIIANTPLSVYDTSEAETGKITSGSAGQTIKNNNAAAVLNFYGVTIENTSTSAVADAIAAVWASVNLYACKVKSNSSAIFVNMGKDIICNIDDTVIESGDGHADIRISLGIDGIVAKGKIDVTDYKGDSLTAKVNVIATLGKITVFKGIKDAQDAEKYQIIDVVCDEDFGLFWEKTEYDEATGEKSIYTANNAFTQQPTNENNFTVDFNNPIATFQWCEVEEVFSSTYIVENVSSLFSYDFKAGDVLHISSDSEFEYVYIEAGREYIVLMENEKTATITFDVDKTIYFFVDFVLADNPVEVNFIVYNETELDGETEKTLQEFECCKSYYCKAIVGEKVYYSDSVTVEHDLIKVDAKAPTCAEIGWDAYEYCTACDYTTYEEIPVHGNTLVKVDAQAVTCSAIGWDAYEYCTACDYTTYNEIPATNHKDTLVQVDAKAKTCTEIGWDAYEYCTACDYTTYNEIPASHEIVKVDAQAVSCTAIGWEAYEYCTDCDYTTYVEIPVVDHADADNDGVCDIGGEQLICSDCGLTVHEETGVPMYICILVTLIKLIVSFFKAVK